MNYIVFDLEWNQSSTGLEETVAVLPFEIIEIGAVKLNGSGNRTGEFGRLIRPDVYRKMNRATGKVIHIRMKELKKGVPFVSAAADFLKWCGEEEYLFCTWGGSDLNELQRNMKFRKMTPLSDGPIAYLDVQKLFSLAYEDGKSRKSLEHAIDLLKLKKDAPFHRAYGDAFYTAEILSRIIEERPEVLERLSYDVFHPPADRASEIRVQFHDYTKYITREFPTKEDAFEDREVASCKCFLCRRNLRKKIRWFSPNGKNYYCLAFCEKHGYVKGKIRVRKSGEGGIYIVKTTKIISPEEAGRLTERRERAKEFHGHRKSQKVSPE